MLQLLAGCTKEKPYKALPKGTEGLVQEAKSIIDTKADYLYVASTVESDRKAGSSRPHWMADSKRVRLVFAEKELKVIEPELDDRFGSNPVNDKLVLTIPIEHIDYKCAEDDFGKCLQKEEENKDIKWDKKRYFVMKGEELALQQLSFLPLEIEKFFGSKCTEEVRSEFVKAEILPDAINLILEKTFQDSCPNLLDFDTPSDLSFSVRYQHSFVKLDKVAAKDYQPIRYTRADEGNFGYFSTQQLKLDVDNNDVVGSEKYYFDRWDPKRKEIIYYLSAAFNKPEHASIKKATAEAVTAINDGFAKAGAATRVILKDPVPGMSSGDVRHNMIVLEEDPQAAGVIGYGPHASNPLTGEIVHAKTIMYLGTMKKYLKYNYDELVKEKLEQQQPAALAQGQPLKLDAALASRQAGHAHAHSSSAGIARMSLIAPIDIIDHQIDVRKLKQYSLTSKTDRLLVKEARDKMEFMSKNCFFPAEMVHLEGDIGAKVDQVLEEVGLKPWIELTEAEKEKVIATLLPFVWKPTLIHEIGHNLGLRHNFAGSEDKANFYTKEELAQMGVSRPAAYSSVMDYAYRTNNELRVMGKYDIAALRYAYAEKVETADGRMISLAELRKNPSTELKAYGYCTDEHVSANPNCNRFDEGTNLLEIARHYVKAYHERYARANFRNDRRKFSMLGDIGQIGAIDNMMFELRLAYERYESIKNTFDLAPNAPEWENIEFLKELKQAALVAGQFFIDVVKTPDLLCAVSRADNPSNIIALLPIREFSKRAISCFDTDEIRLNPQYVIVAEGGKSFQSRKDPKSDNPWADQIDVRGIYMDKLLATHYLFARELGSSLTDQYTENLLHMPELQEPILDLISQVLTDEVSGTVSFRLASGSQVDLNVSYKLFDVNDPNNSHKLPPVMDPVARFIFGLPNETTLFHQSFVRSVKGLMKSDLHSPLANAVLNLIRVEPFLPHDGRPTEYQAINIQNRPVFVHRDSALANLLVNNLQTVSLLGQLSEEQQAKVLKAIADDKEDGLSEVEKIAKSLGKDVIEKFQQGGFQQPGFYALMLQTLAR